ncbi:MAG: hypothetical protein JXX14_11395, partial [Deltaproteobacteria bacterium]|nr:hypothetical protein [Deltaproteobacteria bacterium]
PYTPGSIRQILSLHGFHVLFVQPGLIEKPWYLWQLPESLKWRTAKYINGGTKSILAVGQKK